jgi:hypothetical protein
MREPILKRDPTMAKPNSRPSGMDIIVSTAAPRQPHRDGLVDAAYEGFFSNTQTG